MTMTDRATFDFRRWLSRLQLSGTAQHQIGTVAAITGTPPRTVEGWYYGRRKPTSLHRARLEGVARGWEAALGAHCPSRK